MFIEFEKNLTSLPVLISFSHNACIVDIPHTNNKVIIHAFHCGICAYCYRYCHREAEYCINQSYGRRIIVAMTIQPVNTVGHFSLIFRIYVIVKNNVLSVIAVLCRFSRYYMSFASFLPVFHVIRSLRLVFTL